MFSLPRTTSTKNILLGLFGIASGASIAYKVYQNWNASSEERDPPQEPRQQAAENLFDQDELEAAMNASLKALEEEKTMRARWEEQERLLQSLQEAQVPEDHSEVQPIKKEVPEKEFQIRLDAIGCEEIPDGYCCLVNMTIMTDPVKLESIYDIDDTNMADIDALPVCPQNADHKISPLTRKSFKPVVYKELKEQIEAYVIALEVAHKEIVSQYNDQQKIDLQDEIKKELNDKYKEIKEAECATHTLAPEPKKEDGAKLKM